MVFVGANEQHGLLELRRLAKIVSWLHVSMALNHLLGYILGLGIL